MSLRSLRSRVAALEQRLGGELTTIIIRGGSQAGVGGFASAFGNGVSLKFRRADEESQDAFRARCTAAAQAAGAKFLTIGGLRRDGARTRCQPVSVSRTVPHRSEHMVTMSIIRATRSLPDVFRIYDFLLTGRLPEYDCVRR
jgi:hypothetical protein